MNEKMLCIYHSRDLDGWSSGMIVKRKFPWADLIGYDYGNPIPEETISKYTSIMMVDISFPIDDMVRIAQNCSMFVWIDHHKAIIEEWKRRMDAGDVTLAHIRAVLDMSYAACELTWRYCFPEEDVPMGIELLGTYDSWRDSDKGFWETMVMPFQTMMKKVCFGPDTFPQVLFSRSADAEDYVMFLIEAGKILYSAKAYGDAKRCKTMAFECSFDGYRAIAMIMAGSSTAFKSIWDPGKYDIMISFTTSGKFWTVSVYSTREDIDCSAICKAHGGGGHKGASGFQVADIQDVIGKFQYP